MPDVAKKFRELSLRRKLIVITLSVTAVSLLLLGAGLMLRERLEFERQTEVRLTLLADVIALSSTAPLAFNDPRSASETLAALASDPHVLLGVLYDEKDRMFAYYLQPGAERRVPGQAPKIAGIVFDEGTAALIRPVTLRERQIGKVYVLADSANWVVVLWQFAGIMGGLFVVVLTIGLLMSMWLQRVVTEPIVDLVDVMHLVTQSGDYSLRAKKRADDELGFLVGVFNDMLEEIAKSRAELHTLNDELEERVRRRTGELEIANKELEAFSYSVSHDLRAPLRAIDGFSHALREDYGDKLDEQGKDYLQRVRKGCQRMGRLIDDMLALARVIRYEMRPENVDLSAIAEGVVSQIVQSDPTRAVKVVIPKGLRVSGDPGLLRIALENLLNNAWKFTQKTTAAKIELSSFRKDGETVFCLRDNGAGFDMTYVDKLFRAFQRLHDASAFPGSGIGLATVHRVIQRHGGRIWAEGEVDRGAAFYFTLKEDA